MNRQVTNDKQRATNNEEQVTSNKQQPLARYLQYPIINV